MPRSTSRRTRLRRFAAAATLSAALVPAAGAGAAEETVVHSNRDSFRIPFQVSPADLAAAGATEARLLVSNDGGASWGEGGRATPGEGGFRYDVPADGDLWFSVLTVDAFGNPAPSNVAIVPQLHVRTDRVAPGVELSSRLADDGTVVVRWTATDAAADPDTLSVRFTPDGGAPQDVPVAAAADGSFRIPADRAAGVVTVSVADRAGNFGSASRRLSEDGTGKEVEEPADAAPFRIVPRAADGQPALPNRIPAAPASLAAPTDGDASLFRTSSLRRPAGPPAGPADGAPLRARDFKIGYAVDLVGSSGVGAVDLFITPDGGRHWYRYGEDADRTSPADVTVPGDGEYGFCVRVRSGAGLAPPPPRDGEAPDVRVTVDGTPPSVEILSAAQGRGAGANALTVRWRVSDDRPAAAPVRVELADDPSGPWEPAIDWRPDAGGATLPLRPGQGAPGGRVYVRVTARDAAGNERSAVTPDGVPVDLTRPAARVLGVVR